MSRIKKKTIVIPSNISAVINNQIIKLTGQRGELTYGINNAVQITYENNLLVLSPNNEYADARAQVGTSYSLLNSMIIGVTEGFTKKLQLVGVGYRAVIQDDNIINLFLGFSHPVYYHLPTSVTAECLSQNEIILKGINKQIVGQVAADIRSYRCPEPYKGKGIRYMNEIIRIKETKKK